MRRHDTQSRGLRNNGGVSLIAFQAAGERAVPSTFLIDHGFEYHISRQLYSALVQRLQGHERSRASGLHVAGAPAVEPPVYYARLIGRAEPALRACRHHVRVSVESYILDFEGDLYDHTVRVEFHHFIRDERKFSGVDELKAQILRDAETTREYFAKA